MIPRDFHFGNFSESQALLYLIPIAILLLYAIFYQKKSLEKLDLQESGFLFQKGPQIALMLLGWTFAVIALMNPQGNQQYVSSDLRSEVPSLDLYLLVDTSQSMGVQDGKGGSTRLDQAKQIADRLLSLLKNDQVALYGFGGGLVPLVPITYDIVFTRLLLREVELNEGDLYGTDFTQTFTDFAKLSSLKSGRPKAIVLFSDGEDLKVEKDAFYQKVQNLHIPILTVALGTKEGGIVPDTLKDGQKVISRADIPFLEGISKASSARAFLASENSLEETSERIAQSLKRVRLGTVATDKEAIFNSYFQIPLALALLCFFFSRFSLSRKSKVLSIIALMPLFLEGTDTGENLYQAGQKEEAASWYEGELKHYPTRWLLDKLLYNQGTSLIGKKEAFAAFQAVSFDAYESPLFRLRLLYNKALSLAVSDDPFLRSLALMLIEISKEDSTCKGCQELFFKKLEEALKQEAPLNLTDTQKLRRQIVLLHELSAFPTLPKNAASLTNLKLPENAQEAKKALVKEELLLIQKELKVAKTPLDFLTLLIEEHIVIGRLESINTPALDQERLDAAKFYPFLLKIQKEHFLKGECQCIPWDEVLPLFQEGFEMLTLPASLPNWIYTYIKWEEAKKRISSQKAPEQKNTDSDETTRELQKMEKLDQKTPKKKGTQGIPW